MKRSVKRLITLLLATVLLFTLSTAAFAAGSTVSVQLDGKILSLTDASPIMKDDRNYLPFRNILGSLGATISYDANTKTVKAVRDDVTLQFVIGQTDMKVTKNGVSSTVKTDAASFETKGYTFIPIRFAAEAFGCKVGWDEENQTVLLIDTDKLIQPYDGKFTLMDKLLDYNAQYSEKPYAFTGDMKLDCSVKNGDTVMPISGSGTISGLSDTQSAEMNLKLSLDLTKFLQSLSEEERNDPTLNLMLAQLKNIDFDYIVNLEDGKYYMHSPLLSATMGASADAWLMMDMNTILQDAGLGSMSNLMQLTKGANTTDYFKLIVNMVPLTSIDDYAEMSQILELTEKFMGDSAFTKNGANYTAKFETTQDDIAVAFDCTLNTKNDKVISYQFNLTAKGDTVGQWKIVASQNTSDQVAVTMSCSMPDTMEMSMEMNMQYSETTKEPLRVPAAGATIVDISTYMQP